MTLRYAVEGDFSATFTASKRVKDENDSNKKVFTLKMLNVREGYIKYSGFILYDDNNKVIIRY